MIQRIGKFAIKQQATGMFLLAFSLHWYLEQPVFATTSGEFDRERDAGYRDFISKEYQTAEKHYLNAFHLSKARPEAPYKVALLNAEYADVLARLERVTESASAYNQAIIVAQKWMQSASKEETLGFDRDLNSIKRRLALLTNSQSSSLQPKTTKSYSSTRDQNARSRSNSRIEEKLRLAKKLAREDNQLRAIKTLQKAIVECKSEMGPNSDRPTWKSHRLLVKLLDQLGRLFLSVNQPDQAKDVLLNSYRLKEKLLFSGFPSLVQTTCLLGIAFIRLGDRAEGRRLVESALRNEERLKGADRESAHYWLLVLTEQDGRISDAHTLLSKYIEGTVPATASPARRYDLLSALASRLTENGAPNLGDFCARRASVALKNMEKENHQEDQYANQLMRADSLLRACRFAEGEEICLRLKDKVTHNRRYESTCWRLLAYAQYQLHKFDQADVTVSKALELSGDIAGSDPKGFEETVLYATQIAEAQPDITKLERLLDKLSSQGTLKTQGMAKIKALSFLTLAKKEWNMRMYEKAQKHFREAFSQWTVLPLDQRANLGVAIGDIAMTLQQPQKAITCYQECLKVREQIPKHITNRAFHWRIAFAASRLSRWNESQSELQGVLRETAETNDFELETKALCALCEALIAMHKYDDAKRLIDVYSQKTNSPINRAIALYIEGQIWLREGKIEKGRTTLNDAALLFAHKGDYAIKEAECYRKIAASYSTRIDSLKWLEKAIEVFGRLDMDQGANVAATYLELAKVYRNLNRDGEAATAFNTALTAIKYSDSPADIALRTVIDRSRRVQEVRP